MSADAIIRFLEEDESGGSLADYIRDNYGAFVAYVIGIVFVLMVVGCILREYCLRKYGIYVCPGTMDVQRRQILEARRRILEDERVAMQLQQELEEENQQEHLQQLRKERRRKYTEFLKPYTLTVRAEDFVVQNKDRNTESDSSSQIAESENVFHVYPEAGAMTPEEGSDAQSESCSEQEATDTAANSDSQPRDIETGSLGPDNVLGMVDEEVPPIIGTNQSSDDSELKETCLMLPIYTEDGHPRCVDSSCSVCLLEYEVGDRVVFSTRRVCQHAFHQDCILRWLEKGKKRCPVCRHFFVPGSKIDDKSVITHDEDDRYAIEVSDLCADDNHQEDDTLTTCTGDMVSLGMTTSVVRHS